MGGSIVWTSRPTYCRSCHQISPYYESWRISAHGEIECEQCHWDRGFKGLVQAKMEGLGELVKQIRGKTDGPLRVSIPDSRCTVCHPISTEELLYRKVPFEHVQHLTLTYAGLELACTACHYQPDTPVPGEHIPAPVDPCYACHLRDDAAQRLRDCMSCHDNELRNEPANARFSHSPILQEGIACINCHEDLAEGKGQLLRKACEGCHTDEDYSSQPMPVAELHRAHLSEAAHATCESCHAPIQHTFDTFYSSE